MQQSLHGTILRTHFHQDGSTVSPSAAPATPQVHAPGHASGHAHDHPHVHGHIHGSGHAHAHGEAPAAAPAGLWRGPHSLLMAGAGARLLGVAGLLLLLWAAVAWALGEPA